MSEATAEPIVPDDFEVPQELVGEGFRLEPLGPQHNERDHAAWMGSIDHIRSLPGFSVGGDWPQAMSSDDNLADLEMHDRHFRERIGFTYSVLAGDDVIGCVYIYPAADPVEEGAEIEARCWTTEAGAARYPALLGALVTWMDERWPFDRVTVVGA